MGLIYMRISPSGGKYIGKTIFSEQERWRGHTIASTCPYATDYDVLLSRAIRKYGAENFTATILEDNLEDNKLSEREIYWIDYYKTYYLDNNHGYNMTRGGEGILKYPDNILLQLWNEGYSLKTIGEITGGTPSYLGQRLASLGINRELFKIRGNRDGAITLMKNNPKNKQIYDLWKQGYCMSDIRKKINIDMHTAVNMLKSIYNITEEEIQERKNKAISKSKQKVVYQYDLDNNLIQMWPSISEASAQLKIDNSSIGKCINNKRKTAGGFKWTLELI